MRFHEAFSPDRALDLAFRVFARSPWLLWTPVFVLLLLEQALGAPSIFGLGNLLGSSPDRIDPASRALLGILGWREGQPDAFGLSRTFGTALVRGVPVSFALLLFQSWLRPGVLRVQADLLAQRPPDIRVLVSGSDRFFSVAACRLLLMLADALAAALGLAAAFVVWLVASSRGANLPTWLWGGAGAFLAVWLTAQWYVSLGISFAEYFAVYERLKPSLAVLRSWELVRGHRRHLVWFGLVVLCLEGLGVFVGLLFCCVGVIVVVPAVRAIGELAFTDAFSRVTSTDPTGPSEAAPNADLPSR